MSETVTVTKVEKKPTGWIDVYLEDGRKTSTKNEAIGELAYSSIGTPTQAVIGTTTNGRFTNHYLNAFGDLKDTPKAKRNGSTSASPIPVASGRNDERIAGQWAYGRAVELLAASGIDYKFPLDAKTQAALDEQAKTLLAKAKHLSEV